MLGGLIQDQVTINNRGIPFLKDIPILGVLFGFKERLIDKTELLLLITPRVLGTALDAAKITDEMRRATPELEDAIKKAPRAPGPTHPPTGGAEPSAPAPPPPTGAPERPAPEPRPQTN